MGLATKTRIVSGLSASPGEFAGGSYGPFQYACPKCRAALEPDGEDKQVCRRDGEVYRRVAGIWRLLPKQREVALARFVNRYETVRRLEGRGSCNPDYYRALPYEDNTGRYASDWKIRARSFQLFLRKVLPHLASTTRRSLKILDLGAGNGWLSYRLAQAGHQLAAVDLCLNDFDGLGAHVHYPVIFTPVEAEFDALPFEGGQFDVAIFNASFHYSVDYVRTLEEALRVLRSRGRIVVMDSPVYRDARSGEQMVQERQQAFRERFGFASDDLPHENYLTYDRLAQLASHLELSWEFYTPFYGLRWSLKPVRARLLGLREPARFALIVGARA